MQNEIRYADAEDVQIAYSMSGQGRDVLIVVPGIVSNIELSYEVEEARNWLNALGRNMRVIVYDKRGQGLSDRGFEVPGPEQRMDDISAIAKAEGLDAWSMIGFSEGASTALLYAATYPEKIDKVCVFGGFARFSNCSDYHHMFDEDVIRKSIAYWGTGASGYSFFPDQMPERQEAMARFERACCTPNGYQALLETNFQIDVRSILSEVKVPVLVMHRRDDKAVPVANGRYLADHIPNADYVEFSSGGHICWFGDQESTIAEIERFILRDTERAASTESFLATVLFSDIVDSSARLTEVGDLEWKRLLDSHDQRLGSVIARFGGKFVKSTGDGVLATFDGPARAVRCAVELHSAIEHLGIKVRAGLHIGEVQPRGNDVAGMALHVAARVADHANSDEVLITRTLRDLIAGSGLQSNPRGDYQLKGLPGEWPLYQVAQHA